MKQSDHDSPDKQTPDTDSLRLIPELPVDDEGPVFEEPWQAQAFAMAVNLSSKGFFSWKEWADALATELKLAVENGEPDDGSHYYHHWVSALEKLMMQRNLVDRTSLESKKNLWAAAYRHTPHGKPVTLDTGN